MANFLELLANILTILIVLGFFTINTTMADYISELKMLCDRTRDMVSYETVRVGGPDHIPTFKATVYVNDQSADGEIKNSGKKARQSAAQQLLTHYVVEEEKILITLHTDIDLYVDMENLPLFLNKHRDVNYTDNEYTINVHGFVSTNSPISTYQYDDYGTQIHVIDSYDPNAADVLMILTIGMTLNEPSYHKQMIIATKDKAFSHALKSCITQLGRSAHVVDSFDGYIHYMQKNESVDAFERYLEETET